MKTLIVPALFGLEVAAFANVANVVSNDKRAGVPSTAAARAVSKARTNCGTLNPCLTFDPVAQLVSVSGDHKWVPAQKGQIRGPCPGLNAAANHGYLPRDGVAHIVDTIAGLGEAYGMTPDLAGFLAAYAIIFNGDPLTMSWSIGGPPPSDPLLSGLLGQAQGISYSHNVYEGDTSISRFDAFMNHGNAQELSLDRFRSVYRTGIKTDRYTLDGFVQDFVKKADWSIANNPKYFAPLFSTTLVSPAAYNFVINMMSNHTEEEKGGYLNGEIFKSFFAIYGDYPNFSWKPGYERIPENWYRRPNNEVEGYDAASVFGDLGVGWLAYPKSFKLGGNLNGVNTFSGVDLDDLTGGTFSLADISNYKNPQVAACFFAQAIQEGIPDLADQPLNVANAIDGLVSKYIMGIIPAGFSCPTLGKYNEDLFDKYPGKSYDPTGKATTGGPKKGDNKPDCCAT